VLGYAVFELNTSSAAQSGDQGGIMGKFNSSKTRVAPVFDRLLAKDPIGLSWMPAILAIPRGGTTADICAWEGRGDKQVYGMMVVETPEEAIMFASETLSTVAISNSLPHRSADDMRQIRECFIGATTWKAVCDRCGVPWAEIERLEYSPTDMLHR
jgi:hypothetical protein